MYTGNGRIHSLYRQHARGEQKGGGGKQHKKKAVWFQIGKITTSTPSSKKDHWKPAP